jgi:hypothetical protein
VGPDDGSPVSSRYFHTNASLLGVLGEAARAHVSAILHILALIEGCLLARIEPALDVCDHVFKKHAIQIIGNIGDVGAS